MKEFETNAKKIAELIRNSNPIIIQRHINPDGDALGSQWGLKIIIEDNFLRKKVFVPGDMNDYMKSFFTEPSIINEANYDNALVIICDTANRERISGEFWKKGKNIIKIDHHPPVDQYANLNLVDESASAACQVIAKWAQSLNLKVSAIAARYLFFGLVTDSGRFLYRSVSSETFAVASFLMKQNFNLLALYESLYVQNIKNIRIKGYILSNFKITKNGVAYLIFDKKTIKQLQTTISEQNQLLNIKATIEVTREDFTSQVNVMANISGIKIWLLVANDELDNTIKVSVRSARWIINEVVANHGGGGHQTAAGTKLQNMKQVTKLLADLEQVAALAPQLTNN